MIPPPVTTGLTVLLAGVGTPLFIIIVALALMSFASDQVDLTIIFIEMYRLADMPALTAIPLFALCGFLLARSGAANRLVALSQALLGWLPGGLAVMALSICALLTAFTGASGMTIVAVGGLLFPALQQQRYPERFSLGLLTTSGSLGLLFPPSIPLIVYAIVAEVPVDALFRAGIAPGLLMVFCLALYGVFVGRRLPPLPPSQVDARTALREGALELALPVVVIAGIYSGFIAVSEAAALSVLYVLFVEMLVHREISMAQLPGIVRDTMILVGSIFMIIAAATAYTSYLIDTEVPSRLLETIRGTIDSRLLFLILLNVFLLAVGCMIDMFSALVIVVPLILPIAQVYEVHPVHLGIIFLANLEIGYSTPPVGLNLFIASARLQRPILELYRASLPFLLILLGVLVVITYVPQLSLFTLD
ncbi:MAG: TRAP transporter large permease subunit [Gemmatimonadetes bacterium]|mgnify:FL=1|jgi:C4-dicarboxylate transporter, DctM subunit|nr:TRAP transporter large permease subunit [Gemmatimonadota bacterium]MBT5141974.1 TRAP transporter large permease subunit [Gemmatimonadota bacterium]MBT5589736.1 TRAP transporter large permease subunit [Gemmatimonadota bacterium]MBT5964087.1 TRAP transporter large permease subunit [Gemmatimonadota bacterium]MBT6628848.1 TRAP transporter large permease subunit [Gemmatimonadota bacterium]